MLQKNSLIRTVPLVFVFLLVCGFGQQVFAEHAEENEQEDLFEMPIEELMEIEVETVTTASKFAQKVTDAPSSVTVITADEIRMYGHRTLADILRSVKGFYTSYDRSYEHLGVRGFSLPGDEGSRMLLLLDGNRLNENVRGHGGIGHEFLLDTDLIDRVEIIRGPGSSLYGGNAIFGVINVITKDGKGIDGFEFSGDMFTEKFKRFEAQRGRVTYGKEFKNGMDFLISGTLYGRKGRDLFFPHFVEPPLDGHTKNDDEDSYKLFTKLGLGDLTFEAGYNNREKLIPTAPLGTVFESEWENTVEDDSGFIAVRYDHEFSDKLAMMVRSSFNFYNYRRIGWYTGDDPLMARKTYDRKGTWWNTELQFTAEHWENHKLTWGAEFQYNGRQDQDSSWAGIPYPWGEPLDPCDPCAPMVPLRVHKNTINWGVYIQDEFEILENLTANAGVRYDHYDIGGGSINPRFALIYNHSDATTLKLLYGTAFRPPTLFELYYEDPVFEQPASLDRDHLGPETIETYEVVLEHFFDPSLLGTLSLYHYDLHDSIARQSEYAELTWRSMGKVEATGLEAGLRKRWANGITARASYSLVDTEYQEPILQSDALLGYDPKRMLNSPKHLFKLNLLAPLVKDKVFAGFEVQYDSRRRTIGGWNDAEEQVRDETGDSFVANLTLTWLDVIKNMDLSFGVYNLFDESYAHPAWGDNELDTIEQNGRSFLFNLTYRF
jgi:iron complex outermembrane receptor protein